MRSNVTAGDVGKRSAVNHFKHAILPTIASEALKALDKSEWGTQLEFPHSSKKSGYPFQLFVGHECFPSVFC
jgi:hypothetical protein